MCFYFPWENKLSDLNCMISECFEHRHHLWSKIRDFASGAYCHGVLGAVSRPGRFYELSA